MYLITIIVITCCRIVSTMYGLSKILHLNLVTHPLHFVIQSSRSPGLTSVRCIFSLMYDSSNFWHEMTRSIHFEVWPLLDRKRLHFSICLKCHFLEWKLWLSRFFYSNYKTPSEFFFAYFCCHLSSSRSCLLSGIKASVKVGTFSWQKKKYHYNVER